jgi:hypothetical protein
MSERIHARVAMHRRVEYRHAGENGDGLLMDLSLLGCRIKGVSPFSCGTRLRLKLWLPDDPQPVNIREAVVRWVKDDQFGVIFFGAQHNNKESAHDARVRVRRRRQRSESSGVFQNLKGSER